MGSPFKRALILSRDFNLARTDTDRRSLNNRRDKEKGFTYQYKSFLIRQIYSLALDLLLQIRNPMNQPHHCINIEQHKGFCKEREEA
jgi:hypothetical protein